MTSHEELDLVRSTVRGVLGDGPVDAATLAELGLFGLLVPEELGGGGWCPVEAAVVADEVGRAVSLGGAEEPGGPAHGTSWSSISIGAAALAAAGDPSGHLAATLAGTAPVVAVAGDLPVRDGHVSGSLIGVDLVEDSPAVVVIGRLGETLLIDLDAACVSVRTDPSSIDTTRSLVRVDLNGAPARSLGTATAVRDAAWLLAAATSVGSLRTAVARLVDYLSERIAFGQPIASFQTIQHRIVDLTLLEIRAGVAIDAAARALADDDADPAEASSLACLAHALVVERVPPALDDCVHLTGGIGFTWEYPLHHELRRSVADGTTFGSARRSREILLELTGWA